MEKRDKIFWHEAYVEALELELYEYKDFLSIDGEFRLSKEALRVDVLVIKKTNDVEIAKNIGKIFKGHNLFEFKSELDSFSVWDYHKVLGYAFLYASLKRVPMSDITLSISLTMFPREVIRFLKTKGFEVRNDGAGIFTVHGDIIPLQILESKALPEEENLLLRSLRSNLSAEDLQKALQSYEQRKPLDNKSPFWDRIIKANPNAFREAMSMFTEGVREIFLEGAEEHGWLADRDKKFLTEGITQGISQGISQGITQGIAQGITQGAGKLLELIKSGIDPDEAMRRVINESTT